MEEKIAAKFHAPKEVLGLNWNRKAPGSSRNRLGASAAAPTGSFCSFNLTVETLSSKGVWTLPTPHTILDH